MVRRRLLAFVILLSGAQAAAAQGVPAAPDPSNGRVRVGPLWINPTLSLSNFGVDTNVFNEADTDSPESDLTMTVTPAAQLWVAAGRTWILGEVREDVVWYKDFVDQRSANGRYTAGWLAPLTRIGLYGAATWVNTRERPGFEIDARAKRWEQLLVGAVEVRALARTLVGVRGDRREIEFDENEVFLGADLSRELTRTQTTGAVTVRHEVTPVTSLVFDVARTIDRFKLSPLRDADSTQASLGFRFDPVALLNGGAQIGIRDFEPADPALPPFTGMTAAVDLTYVAFESSRFGLQVARDINYSFDINQPYYLQTGVSGAIAQRIFGPLDAQARLVRYRLSYRNRATPAASIPEDRVDLVLGYGGGLGCRLGRDLRIGFNVDQQKRTSDVSGRSFEGLRYGVAATYGLGL